MVRTITERLDELDVLEDWQQTGNGKMEWSRQNLKVIVEKHMDKNDVFRISGFVNEVEDTPEHSLEVVSKEELESSLTSFVKEFEKAEL